MASSDEAAARARQRLKRAQGLVRQAIQELAAADTPPEPLRVVRLERGADTARVGEVLSRMLEHGPLELTITRAPAEPAPHTTMAPPGA